MQKLKKINHQKMAKKNYNKKNRFEGVLGTVETLFKCIFKKMNKKKQVFAMVRDF